MRALATVTARELRAQTPILIAALATATLAWITPLLPGVVHGSGAAVQDVRTTTALVLAALLGTALAVFAGAALLARDVADGRIGFFLALPLRARTIWGSRLLAAIVLVYGSIALVLLPALVDWRSLPLRDEGATVALLAAAPLVLLLLANHLAIALRSRSPWLLVDLAALAVSGALASGALLRLRAAAATSELVLASAAGGTLALVTLLLSSGVALARGGALLRRVHRVQMVCVTAGLLVASAAVAAYGAWVLHPGAADVTAVDAAMPAPAGTWLAAAVNLRGRPTYHPWMLFDSASGRTLTLAPAVQETGYDAPTFASDGRSVVWLQPTAHPYNGPGEVQWADLGGIPRPTSTGITVGDVWTSTLLPQGDRLALAERDRLALWSGHGQRLLVAATLPRERVRGPGLLFLDADRLRLLRVVDGADYAPILQRFELSLATHRLSRQPDLPMSGDDNWVQVRVAADGERLLVLHGYRVSGGVELIRFGTAERRFLVAPSATQEAPGEPRWGQFDAAFLPDGSIAVAAVREGRATLALFDAAGAARRELPLGEAHGIYLGGLWSHGALPFTAMVPAPPRSGRRYQGELREIDLSSGRMRIVGSRMIPLAHAGGVARGEPASPGVPASTLFRDHRGALVRLTPSGERRQLLPLPG